jgi:8-oxo-dGDP phosphatase
VAGAETTSGEWLVHGERTVYDNPWVRLVLVDVEPPSGRRFEHHVVRLQRVALALVSDVQDRVLMLRRHRFVTGQVGWELPGGIVDAGESSVEAARRETAEETGWEPAELRPLAAFQPMIGMVDTPHDVFWTDVVRKIGDPTDVEESGEVGWVAAEDVIGMIDRGQILGSGSIVGLLRWLAMRTKPVTGSGDEAQ